MTRRAWRARTLAALGAVVAIALSGCTFASGPSSTTSTPLTGDVDAALKPFYSQTLEWTACHTRMLCATAKAPLDWSDPGGESIDLAMIRSTASGSRQGSLFVNPGGPGASGVDMLANGASAAVDQTLAEHFDIVSWDPRGVGASTAISCGTSSQLDDFFFGIANGDVGSSGWWNDVLGNEKQFAQRCEQGSGDLVAHVDSVSSARDLDMMRALVGDAKLNYLGYSYGTFLGSVYAQTFPQNTGHLVLDGAVDPAQDYLEGAVVQAQGFESALRAYLTSCIGTQGCPFSGSVDDAMADIRDVLTRLDESPLRASDGRELGGATMATAIILPLYSESNWDYLDQLFTSVAKGDPSVAFALADSYYERDSDGSYSSNLIEAFFAIGCLDSGQAESVEQLASDAAAIDEAAPYLGRWLGPLSGNSYSGNACAVWPAPAVIQPGPITAAGSAPILVIGTTNDPATPYRNAQSLASQLENGHLVTYTGEGHTAYNGSSSCVNDTVDEYFVKDVVPASDPQC